MPVLPGDITLVTHLGQGEACPRCSKAGSLRPHVVWFGEMPLFMEEIQRRLQRCALFVSIGTSGNVYPAAGFVQDARAVGARTVELNLSRPQERPFLTTAIMDQRPSLSPVLWMKFWRSAFSPWVCRFINRGACLHPL